MRRLGPNEGTQLRDEPDFSLRYNEASSKDGHGNSLQDKLKQTSRSTINWTEASYVFIPKYIRYMAIEPSIELDKSTFGKGDGIVFRFRFRNRLPFPIKIKTENKIPWSWSVNGIENASYYTDYKPPNKPGIFVLDKSETKVYTRKWSQMFRTSKSIWEKAEPGQYEVATWVNVTNPESKGLHSRQTFNLK